MNNSMNWDSAKIKGELQGSTGLIKRIRNEFIPTTDEMSKLAQDALEKHNVPLKDIDEKLDWLLTKEYQVYLSKQGELIDRFIELADEYSKDDSFPETRKIIDDFKKKVKLSDNPAAELDGVIRLIITLADSNRQSRVSRAGSGLMHHISYLLMKEGFEFQKDYQREYVLKTGCKLDFFFPDVEMYHIEPKNCVAVACQTTSNDRFRLTFAQMPNDTRNRACTAIGNSNFGDKLGPASLTDTKLEEAKKEGVKFVVIGSAIDARLRNSNTVISYQEWFDELKMLKPFWTT